MLSEDLEEIQPAPWARNDWTGELISADGVPADDFEKEDVLRVVWWSTTEEGPQAGETAGVAELKDGRYVAWEEAGWGWRGMNGFSGGTANIIFAQTQAAAEACLSDEAKQLPRVIDSEHECFSRG